MKPTLNLSVDYQKNKEKSTLLNITEKQISVMNYSELTTLKKDFEDLFVSINEQKASLLELPDSKATRKKIELLNASKKKYIANYQTAMLEMQKKREKQGDTFLFFFCKNAKNLLQEKEFKKILFDTNKIVNITPDLITRLNVRGFLGEEK